MIPFLDLKAPYLELRSEIDAAVFRVLRSGWFIGGDEVENFESEFAEFCEVNYTVGTANGLDALHLALRAMGVTHGDEVIVPSNTYIATWLAVTQCGATPVPVEPDISTYNIDPVLIKAAISPRTKVIIPVHLFGLPADLSPILAIAKEYGLLVLEDAAQAHGAYYRGKRIGGHSDAVAWSFYPGKNLGAMGDGGAVTTNNEEIADRIRVLRNYGSREKYINEVQGYNSRLDPLQAAILRVKLAKLDEWNARRRAIAQRYAAALADCDLGLPQSPGWALPSWHLFVIQHSRRDALEEHLARAGITTLVHYPIPPHQQRAYSAGGFVYGNYKIADCLAGRILSIPMGPHMPVEDQAEVIREIRTFCSKG